MAFMPIEVICIGAVQSTVKNVLYFADVQSFFVIDVRGIHEFPSN